MRFNRAKERRRLAELRSVDLFGSCTDEELRAVDGLGARIPLDAGTRLISEGAAARECYVLLEGAVAVSCGGSPVTTLGPGSIVGETALLNRSPRNATVEALTPVFVILMHHAEFATLMRIPAVAAKVRREASQRRNGVGQLKRPLRRRASENLLELQR